jgi:hypothetical protein
MGQGLNPKISMHHLHCSYQEESVDRQQAAPPHPTPPHQCVCIVSERLQSRQPYSGRQRRRCTDSAIAAIAFTSLPSASASTPVAHLRQLRLRASIPVSYAPKTQTLSAAPQRRVRSADPNAAAAVAGGTVDLRRRLGHEGDDVRAGVGGGVRAVPARRPWQHGALGLPRVAWFLACMGGGRAVGAVSVSSADGNLRRFVYRLGSR